MVSLPEKRQAVKYISKVYNISDRRACKLIDINRKTNSYRLATKKFTQRSAVIDLSVAKPRWGYRKIYDSLRLQGFTVGKERVRIIRKEEGLQVRKKQHKKRAIGKNQYQHQAEYPNHVWSWDFMFDATTNGRSLKILNIIDEYTKECLLTVTGRSIRSVDVLKHLRRLFVERGYPKYIRSDNGPEFVAKSLKHNIEKSGAEVLYIEPGSPWQNGFVESFNSIMRDNLLNRYLFHTPKEAQQKLDVFKKEYNEERPHGAIGGIPPMMFRDRCSMQRLCA